jgi:outer membrane protein OmpA-like peptidoglycan-associated protein
MKNTKRNFKFKNVGRKNLIASGLLTSLALTLGSAVAQAGEVDTSTASGSGTDSAQGFHQPYLFGGVDAGYANLSSNVLSEGSRDGYQPSLKLLGSVYFPSIVLDAGVGWMYSQVSGQDSPTRSVTISTRNGFAEIAPRYRIDSHWQIGPSVDMAFGTDEGFAPENDPNNIIFFAGAQVFYEIPLADNRLRVGARWMRDLNITDRTLNSFQLSVQFGIPLMGSPAPASPDMPPTASTAPEAPPAPLPPVAEIAPAVLPEPDLKLSVSMVHFDTGSVKIRQKSRQKLALLSQFLVEHAADWGKLEIDGHADARGSFKSNLRLSKKRAESVRRQLIASGVDGSKLALKAFSHKRPQVSGADDFAYAMNRRVEFRFYGVKNVTIIRDKVHELERQIAAVRQVKRHR